MIVLGIESTCDETSVAIVKDGHEILAHKIASQELHQLYGGVVPELACRRHIDVMDQMVEQVLNEASLALKDIDLLAVPYGPGLIGALLIGLNYVKGLSMASGIPFVGVNHVEAHLYAALMNRTPLFPALGLVLSGGHSHLVWMKKVGHYELLGKTIDDALGEAFDKAAALLDLPYPGGPHIEKLAKLGDPLKYPFKCGTIKNSPFDFSFSGLKTAVLYTAKGQNANKHAPSILSEQEKCDVAASFQHAAFCAVRKRIENVLKEITPSSIVLGGGVVCNQALREFLEKSFSLPFFFPPKVLTQDNAAMIAGLGYHQYQNGGPSDVSLAAHTRIQLPDASHLLTRLPKREAKGKHTAHAQS
jgi:N6-L-threonylcarbamoyladenine synthase